MPMGWLMVWRKATWAVNCELGCVGDLNAEADNLDPEAAPSDAHIEYDLLGGDSN